MPEWLGLFNDNEYNYSNDYYIISEKSYLTYWGL